MTNLCFITWWNLITIKLHHEFIITRSYILEILKHLEKILDLDKFTRKWISLRVTDEAKNDPFLGGHLSPNPTLFDQILP